MIRRVVFALFVGGILAHPASAQTPPEKVLPTPQAPPVRDMSDLPPPPPAPAVATRSDDQARAAEAKRAITRANPPSRRASVARVSDTGRGYPGSRGQFANPGGVGRYAEYYTESTPTTQLDLHALPPTGFDRGGGPNRASQIASFRAGQQRTANIQNNINAYGRPYGAMGAGIGLGFGFGYGLAGGGLYGGGLR